MKMIIILLALLFSAIFTSCEKPARNTRPACDQDVIISETEYQEATTDSYAITSLEISGNCLSITITASGCDGSSWEVSLIDSGAIAESYPCQRTLRLILKNEEVCDAVPSRKVSFNIKDLQLSGYDKLILNISEQKITYEY